VTEFLHRLHSQEAQGKGRDRAGSELARAHRFQRPLSFALLDIGGSEGSVAQYGQLAVETMLREVARRVLTTVRRYDSVGRWGGAGSASCCLEATLPQACAVAERIVAAVSQRRIHLCESVMDSTLSAGVISAVQPGGVRLPDLEAAADDALDRARRASGNRAAGGFATRRRAA